MYKFKQVEKEVSNYWKEHDIYNKAQKRCKDGEIFYFLDGPPYTSGKVHLGTAWNKSLKDMVLRYKRMKGFNVWDRAGYDMHGLPTAHKVQEKFDLKTKEDIEEFGVEKFIKECRKLSVGNMEIMNKDFRRLGVWMDFEGAYQSVKSEFIEGVWWLVKKAHENNRLYEGKMSMTWCKSCGTALAKHELEYETVYEDSIFVKFPVIGEDEYLVIWTTTPWTIPYNLAVMVNPELKYVRAKVEDEVWIVAKQLAGTLIGSVADKKFEIIEEFKGDELEGLKYRHPFHEFLEPVYEEIMEKSDKAFSVVLSEEYVNLSAGSGLVHTAPGCGPEDFEVGHREGIPAFNNLDEEGVFPESMGPFAGLTAKDDDKKFIDKLEEVGALIAVTKVEHEYAHCWRCKEPVIYRTTKQWFFKIEDLKKNMRELNKDIYWIPDYAGSRNFDSWLENLRDNGITRQRYWGTPLPVWRCEECGEYVVIGSTDELKEKAGKVPDDLHKPWIDEIEFDCECGGKKKRIPDILDVWIDAGSASWLCLDYPHREDLFKKMYPADFILEGIDQIRGWFNMLFVASMVSMEKPSFKACYMHGFINDAQGRKMSKSTGNYILPEEVLEKYGADALRYYTISGTNPGEDLRYNFDDMKVKFGNLNVLWNLHKLLISGCELYDIDPRVEAEMDVEEKYMTSMLHSTIKRASDKYDKYFLTEAPEVVEELFLELSRNYVKMTREKLSLGSEQEKQKVLSTVYKVLVESLKMFAPVAPYITEGIYQEMRNAFDLEKESIHLYDWPGYDEELIDEELERDFQIIENVIQKLLYGRQKMGLGLRWPLKQATIVTDSEDVKNAVERLMELVEIQTNIREIVFADEFDAKENVRINFEEVRNDYGGLAGKVFAQLTIMSDQSILKHLEDGEYKFKVDNADVVVKPRHFIIEKEAPEGYVYTKFDRGELFIDTSLNKDLEAEGYARELMRRVQSMRKKMGLEKSDDIVLHVKADEELCGMLSEHREDIKEKVGAAEQTISTDEPENFDKSKEFSVKDKKFTVFIKA